MSNRIGQVPRSIKFNEKSIKNFVKVSSFLNVNSNLNSTSKQNYHENTSFNNNRNYAKTDRNFDQNYKLIGFDFYNKNNLLLKACNVEDVQYVTKSPILYEEEIIVMPDNQYPHSYKNIPNNKPTQNEKKIKTMKDFYKPKVQQIQNQNINKSKQAELNQFLFNYRKKEEDKKNKKLKFIEQIEKKLNNLQRQANGLQDQKIKQFQQINGILKISNDTTQYAKRAEMLGKINTALYEIQNERKIVDQPKKITEDMELLQINVAIQQHHEYNDALFDQIQRVSRSKSKQRVKASQNYYKQTFSTKLGKTSNYESQPQHILNKTIKKFMQAPPRPTSVHKKQLQVKKSKKIQSN